MPVAVIDIGTNTTRLLVAERDDDGGVVEVERRTTITTLGQGVDETGRLADEAMERVAAAIAEYREVIDRLGAERVVAVATSAMRDAENGLAFRERLNALYGVDARTISGDEEAQLTFLGATSTRDLPGSTLVIDIGGGSTELVAGRAGGTPEFHVSTQAGAVRQTERHLPSDPVPDSELAPLREEVRGIVAAAVPEHVRRAVEHGIAVAGTATSLAAIDQQLDPYDPERVHGYPLGLAAAERILARLAAMSVSARRELPGLLPGRAPTIVAGAVILVESMRAFGLESVEVSEADILHGTAIDAVLYGGDSGGTTG
jgi:exopolyphosphatase / guanosine-5'-triphosphate,3'-diphosphate pyrophosphatase